VEQIFGRLRNEEFESSSVVGDRRIGKTSLLNYLADPSIRANTMDLGGFSLAWLRDLAFCAALEAERDSW
jgi:hypothetical protein